MTMSLLLALLLVVSPVTQARGQRGRPPAPTPAPAARATFFVPTLTPAEMQNKQAVLETAAGVIVMDLLADAAPNHVAHFITRAREGAYDGTVFHRVIPLGIIQGGDPLSKDPARSAQYGTGGLNALRFEPNAETHTRGAVSAVLVPGNRDSAGSQFFICVTDQPALDGNYTVFARVVEGLATAARISQAMTDTRSAPLERMVISRVTIRDKPAPVAVPFSTETVEELSKYRATLETTLGRIVLEFFPDRAPNHVRNFLRLAQAGVYDGTAFHRVVPGFVIQGGFMPSRREPLDDRQEVFVQTLAPEFNDTPHEKGILSMARTADPASASTSFFIVTARASALDRTYSVFGRVVEGLEVVEKIETTPVNGEAPITRVEVTKVTLARAP
jgi:peptidyl-prolyl cis-trans isomerase B (cyclophilin B)